MWISGYTAGEGCFTASVMLNSRARWGMWPQCEFNIAQSAFNQETLIAINHYFGESGGIYIRQNGIGTVSFRDLKSLKTHMGGCKATIPFFKEYPLLGTKSLEFEIWIELTKIMEKKEYTTDSLASRDKFIEFLKLSQTLNARATSRNTVKIARSVKIINWLNSLEEVPDKESKSNFIRSLKKLPK